MRHHIPPTGKVFLGWVEQKIETDFPLKLSMFWLTILSFCWRFFFIQFWLASNSLSPSSFYHLPLSLFLSASFSSLTPLFLIIENLIENKRELEEASYFDRINMTKYRLEFDRKQFTPTNLNVGTWPKIHTNEP